MQRVCVCVWGGGGGGGGGLRNMLRWPWVTLAETRSVQPADPTKAKHYQHGCHVPCARLTTATTPRVGRCRYGGQNIIMATSGVN